MGQWSWRRETNIFINSDLLCKFGDFVLAKLLDYKFLNIKGSFLTLGLLDVRLKFFKSVNLILIIVVLV